MNDTTTPRNHNTDRDLDLLTITEAAELVRAPVATLRYWRHLGTGPSSFRLGRRVVYSLDDLRAWIDAQRNQSSPGDPDGTCCVGRCLRSGDPVHTRRGGIRRLGPRTAPTLRRTRGDSDGDGVADESATRPLPTIRRTAAPGLPIVGEVINECQ